MEKVLCFFYTSDYSDYGQHSGDAVINVLVYALADKYDVTTLKPLAKQKFEKAMADCWNTDAFSGVALQIYTTTPSSDRGLRDCAKVLMEKHKEALRWNEAFRSLLQAGVPGGDFVLDVIDAWVR